MSGDFYHPYRAPGAVHDRLEATRRKLRIGGGVALGAALFWFVYAAGLIAFAAAGGSGAFNPYGSPSEEDIMTGLIIGLGGGGYFLILSVMSLVGGIGMILQRPWGRAAGLVAALAQMLGGMCGCVFGMLPAIGLFLILIDSDARRAFEGEDPAYRPPG